MSSYYVNSNAQPNGDHEVHKQGCSYMPMPLNCVYVGEHSGCRTAVAAAKQHYPSADGCYHCSPLCHTA